MSILKNPDYQDLEERQMLLRFAGKAMGALVMSSPIDSEIDRDQVAVEAFELAEAMVAEYHRRKAGSTQT